MHFVTHWNAPTGKFDVLLCFQKTIGRMVQLFRAMEEISAMSHNILRKSHILFQITLNFVLCAFQFLAYFGLCVISRPFGFYAMLCAAVPVAALLITSAGGYLSYRLYKNGKNCLRRLFFSVCKRRYFAFIISQLLASAQRTKPCKMDFNTIFWGIDCDWTIRFAPLYPIENDIKSVDESLRIFRFCPCSSSLLKKRCILANVLMKEKRSIFGFYTKMLLFSRYKLLCE